VLRFIDSVLRAAALALFALFLLTSLPRTVGQVAQRGLHAVAHAAETPAEERRRTMGPGAAETYDRLRRMIPRDGEYLLIDGGSLWQGSPYWVRFELAPRKPRLVGALGEMPKLEEILRRWPASTRFAVVAPPEGQLPAVYERKDLLALQERERSHAGR
jgi:hypothetical protein